MENINKIFRRNRHLHQSPNIKILLRLQHYQKQKSCQSVNGKLAVYASSPIYQSNFMYSEYLDNFKRLIGLLGEDDATQLVRSQCDSTQDKISTEYICSRRLNIDYRNKFFESGPWKNTSDIPPQGKVLKSYWLSKVLKREPMLFVLVFNFSRPLDPIQKFQDRLAIANTDINNAKEYLRMQNQKHVVLNYLVITGGQGSQVMADKTKEFLKISDRSLQITTIQSLKMPNQIKRIRSNWMYYWDKAADERYKRRERKLEQAQRDQTKLNCYFKLAVLNDIMGKQSVQNGYENAYAFCKKIHQGFQKARGEDLQVLIPLYEYRRISDAILFRILFTVAKTRAAECLNRVVTHFAELSTRRQYPDRGLSSYTDSEQINWKAEFLETALKQLLLLNAIVSDKDKQKFTQYLNAVLSYRMGLTKIKYSQTQRKLEAQDPLYFGRLSYKIQNDQKFEDLKETRLIEFSKNKQTYLMDSINLIVWVRELPTLLRPNELQILRLTLLRLYLASGMIDDALNLYNQIVDFYLNRKDFFILNHLLHEIQSYLQNDQQRNSMVKFHLISLRIADSFGSNQHIEEFVKHLKDTLAQIPASSKMQSVPHPLNRHSLLIRTKVDMGSKMLSLAEKRVIKIEFEINPCLHNFFEIVDVEFNIDTNKSYYGLKLENEMQLHFQPSDFVLEEERMLEIHSIVMRSSKHHVHAVRTTRHIDYKKYLRIFISMPISNPQIIAKPIHGNTEYFVNEVFPVSLQVVNKQVADTKLHIKVIFHEDISSPTRTQPTTKPNECFLSLVQQVNLLNVQPSKVIQNQPLIFYLKFPYRGDKRIKVILGITSQKRFKNSRGEDKIVKKNERTERYLNFTVVPLLILRKKLKIHSSEILNKRIRLDNEIWDVPRKQKIFAHFTLKSAQTVLMTSMKQQQISEDILFLRPINLTNINLEKNATFKAVSVIQVQSETSEILKIPPLVIRWRRLNSSIQNTLIDEDERIMSSEKVIGLQIKQIDNLRKGEIGQVHYKIINYQDKQMDVRIEALENETMILIGKNKRDLVLSELSNVILSFKILPLIAGEIAMPDLIVQFVKDKALNEVKMMRRHTALSM